MSKRPNRRLLLLLAGLLPAPAPAPAMGHAAVVHADDVQAVRVEGRYATGEPMAGAQVTVYAPVSPAEPWRRGQTNADGVFLFVPGDQPGRWAVQLRQAGHGGTAYVELAAEATAPVLLSVAPTPAPSPVQTTVMAVCVVWGCIGTALYFRRIRAS